MEQTMAEYRAKLAEAGLVSSARRAYWRGRRVRAVGHPLTWYVISLQAYKAAELCAFLDGYHGRPFAEITA
jgi:hypothetical protein